MGCLVNKKARAVTRQIRVWQVVFLIGAIVGALVAIGPADSAMKAIGVVLIAVGALGFFALIAIVSYFSD